MSFANSNIFYLLSMLTLHYVYLVVISCKWGKELWEQGPRPCSSLTMGGSALREGSLCGEGPDHWARMGLFHQPKTH